MDGDAKLGNLTTVKVIKNKLAPPFTKASFNILYGIGIDKMGELIELGKDTGVLKLRAGVITYGEAKYTEQEFVQMMIDNPDWLKDLKKEIMAELGTVNKEEVLNESTE